jgi:adenosylhomocysteine nucleosidase
MGPCALSQSVEQKVTMKRLGIVAAMGTEARSLVKRPIVRKRIIYLPGGAMIQVSGIGPERASSAAKALMEEGATALLSWGSAGGLNSKLSPGSLVLPKVIIRANRSIYSTDAQWHQRLSNRLRGYVDLHEGPLGESPAPLKNHLEKENFYRRTEAIAVDMESGAVAAAAQEADVSFMAIRAVSDPFDAVISASILNAIDECGELDMLRFTKGLMRHPFELFSLIRLGQNFRAANITLGKVACLTGTNLLVS